MARFFKPLLGAVALAAATLTSTGAFAAYAYNAQITITAPKGSTAEAAAKNKALPIGIKYSTCAPKITAVTPNVQNIDMLNFAVKYDAGKDASEIGDVFVILQNLTDAAAARYYAVSRTTGVAGGVSLVAGGGTITALDTATVGFATVKPFLAASDNLGSGAQTEVLFGGNLNLTGLPMGLWSLSVIIAPPGASYLAAGAETGTGNFSFGHPESWAAQDTVVFALGTPMGGVQAVAPNALATDLTDYATVGVNCR
ncbi:hypothetical protein [Giesbergeria anulus]|uniref:DUF1120 domain-containing protein n=1 Tax=Giesbergeria anulus TaxID=180197 RepID=A0A1H9MVJ9_9BURK|nr:hypothetical protein [Giesbergeria anulus]SER27712.1 hypothetical protein SAMN02982919_02073 [Giesbergeria anulus]